MGDRRKLIFIYTTIILINRYFNLDYRKIFTKNSLTY